MGDGTLVQLLENARRQRDGDAARQWTTSDWLALPVVAVVVLVIAAWVLVAGVVNAIRGLFLQPVEQSNNEQTDQRPASSPCAEQAEP
jgi:hypothetical protein